MRALELDSEMARCRVVRNAILYNAAVSFCVKSGHWLRALQLMAELAQGREERNTITCCAALSAYQMSDELLLALGLMAGSHGRGGAVPRQAQRHHIQRSVQRLRKERPVFAGAGAHGKVGAGRVERNTITYSAAISACETGGQSRVRGPSSRLLGYLFKTLYTLSLIHI